MSTPRDRFTRSLLPSALLGLRGLRLGRRAARLGLGLGRRPRMELWFAFDDPYAAVALPELVARFASRVTLALCPIVDRPIVDRPDPTSEGADPSLAERRARHALLDARRLMARPRLAPGRIGRREPLLREDGRRAAELTAALAGRAGAHALAHAFAAQALALFFEPEEGPPPSSEALLALFSALTGEAPPAPGAQEASLLAHAARMRRAGAWASPTARVAGELFFAHERFEAIEALLEEIGA